MEDLDQLQQDLEKLLSTCAVRHRILRAELNEDNKHEKGRISVKRKRPNDKLNAKENCLMILKAKYLLKLKTQAPKISGSAVANRFWRMINDYCANITKDDIAVSIFH